MRRHSIVVLAVVLFATIAAVASGSETQVGTTKDACDKSHDVTFETSSGKASVPANATKSFDLPAMTNEITWYCGGSRERSANGTQFNKVKIHRAANGAIQWTFFRVSGQTQATGQPQRTGQPLQVPLVRVGDSRDACDQSQPVTFNAKSKKVTLRAGQMVLEELPNMAGDMNWKCGSSNERVANPNAFDFIQAERAGNGAIQWVFYRTMTDHDDSTGNYLDLLPGDVVIQAPALKTTVPQPGFLKKQLDTFWDGNRSPLQAQMLKSLQKEKSFQVHSLTLSPAAQTEVRVGDTADDILLKYVVHHNLLNASAEGANFNAIFDLELVMVLAKQQTLPFQATRATAFVHHFELHGASAGDDFLAAFAKSRIHAVEMDVDSSTQDVKKDVNAALAKISGQVGAPSGTKVVLQETAGTVQACVKLQPSDTCSFPAVAAASAPKRKTLDTSHDQCSEEKIWMWDYQKGGFVPIAKGGSAEIEVDNQRFEWFCGGGNQPNTANDEWAVGPEGTYFVHVKRDPSGRQIDWTFQSWQ